MPVNKKWSKVRAPHRRLYSGSRGLDVAQLQHALNRRAKSRMKYGAHKLEADGEFGKATHAQWVFEARAIGLNHRKCTPGNQTLMRLPYKRSQSMKAKEKAWTRHAKAAAARKRTGPASAAGLALHYASLNIVEHPAGSNSGPYITGWQRSWGFGAVAWCGIFAGAIARASGAKGLTSRVASVGAIEEDAKAHRNGFTGWFSPQGAHVGDMVVLFGYGVHVETVVGHYNGGLITVGGNTSFEGAKGSQSNGGCVAKRYRSYGVVRGAARVHY